MVEDTVYDPLVAECLALHEGLNFARTHNLRLHEVESDCQLVVKVVRNPILPTIIALIVRDIHQILGSEIGCNFARREPNSVAHSLVVHVCNSTSNSVWLSVCPPCIQTFVSPVLASIQ